jgi:hypothetical protein
MRSTTHLALLPLLALASLAACGGATDKPAAQAPVSTAAAPPKADAAKPKGEDEAAKKAAALETLTAEEAKSGTCDPDHAAALEKLLSDIEAAMTAKTGEDGKPLGLKLMTKKVLALGSSAKGVEMSVTSGATQLHVMAYGVKDVSLDVLQGNTAATTMRSPFQRTPMAGPVQIQLGKIGTISEMQSDSRQVQLKPGQFQVKLTGQGCAGLIAFSKG